MSSYASLFKDFEFLCYLRFFGGFMLFFFFMFRKNRIIFTYEFLGSVVLVQNPNSLITDA
jgi:hypothetical protein